jgi:hypothetical protein
MAARKEELNREMETLRAEWQADRERHEAEVKEREAAERFG